MAQEYYPFDSGAGSGPTDMNWRRMSRLWAPSGVDSGLAVSIGTGSTVNVAAGSAWVDGHFYRNTATVAVLFDVNTTASPQLVRVVLRLDTVANTITLVTKSAAPALNFEGVYELILAEFTLPPTGTAQTPTNLVDRRWFLSGEVVINQTASGSWNQSTEIQTHPTYTIPASPFGPNVQYIIDFRGEFESSIPAGGNYIYMPRVDGLNVAKTGTSTWKNTTSSTAIVFAGLLGRRLITNPDVAHTVNAVYQCPTGGIQTIGANNALFVSARPVGRVV